MSSANKWLLFMFLLLFTVNSYAMEEKAVDFRLDNLDGRIITMQDLKDKVVVLTFSYSFCSVRCPIITGRLHSLDNVMDAPGDAVYLHVSVDPGMDTPGRRLKYFSLYDIDAQNDGRWMFVSGGKDELSRIWKFYGITVKRIEDKNLPEGYFMEYTPKLVIIDKRGFIRHVTGFFFSEDEIAKKIKELTGG